jgi:hypothetical protein
LASRLAMTIVAAFQFNVSNAVPPWDDGDAA